MDREFFTNPDLQTSLFSEGDSIKLIIKDGCIDEQHEIRIGSCMRAQEPEQGCNLEHRSRPACRECGHHGQVRNHGRTPRHLIEGHWGHTNPGRQPSRARAYGVSLGL